MASLYDDLKRGDFHPIYVLTGDEEFEKRGALNAIRSAILGGKPDVLNESKLLWKETDPDEIVTLCQTLPMMSPRRLVLVQDVDSVSADQSRVLATYLENPAPTTTLVLAGASIDQRLKMVTIAKKIGTVLSFRSPYANKIPSWIERHVRSRGARIEGAASDLLSTVIGTDLVALADAIERLLLYIGEESPTPMITVDAVENCIARTKVHSIFELTDALGRKQAAEALQIVAAMMESKEAPIRIVAMIARHFRRLWEAQQRLENGESPDQIGQQLRVHSFFLRDFLRQAQLFTPTGYETLFHRLFETDRSLKSSRAAAELHIQQLILEICTKGASTSPAPSTGFVTTR
jgi:DNA polymerase-3 subunit delta